MEKTNSVIEVKYLGKDSERKDGRLYSKPPYNFYEMIIHLNGEEYIAVLETAKSIKMQHGLPDWDHPYKKLRVHEILGPEDIDYYEEFKEIIGQAEDEEIGIIGGKVNINLDDVILDFDFYDESPYNDIQKTVMEDFYQRKRRSLIASRRKSLDERVKLHVLDDILAQLPELSQQERVRKMHERMVQCVVTGRYGLKEYYNFLRNLVEVVRDGKIFISDAVLEALRNNFNANYGKSKHVRTFPLNSRKNIANSTIDELGEVNKSSSKTKFSTMEIEPIEPEVKTCIDEIYQEDSATTLGRITYGDRLYIQNMLNYNRTGIRDTFKRGEFYVAEDEQGDIIFTEQPDFVIEEKIEAKRQKAGTESELEARERRLQEAEREARQISDAENLIEQMEDKTEEQSKGQLRR